MSVWLVGTILEVNARMARLLPTPPALAPCGGDQTLEAVTIRDSALRLEHRVEIPCKSWMSRPVNHSNPATYSGVFYNARVSEWPYSAHDRRRAFQFLQQLKRHDTGHLEWVELRRFGILQHDRRVDLIKVHTTHAPAREPAFGDL